jgi:hypothetical protein
MVKQLPPFTLEPTTYGKDAMSRQGPTSRKICSRGFEANRTACEVVPLESQGVTEVLPLSLKPN